ncbi:MAG: DNA ligase D [Oxalicibacterium faecigallinarum]|uniref:DNA ligase D n=1 Tax=Oxalicibacterium faecigallinarum TaxID=573741 RepID=UPI002807529F|nr:DNA ligase D [Oxalicibacterium faecigallinarum]MDQ7970129.1 DNA ligase D [Oxalicibacterium faecigallinarum]
MAKSDTLAAYREKRDFSVTSEPAEGGSENTAARSFVVQKHWATRLHYDFRLELGDAMKSWAVPKGPSFDPKDKRMAVHVEDHPISYNTFEGQIPEKQYGAGKVIVWDRGTWHPIGDPRKGYRDGNLKFELHGHKLQGKWALIRMKGKGEKKEPWLLIKEKDHFARASSEFSVVDELPDSVLHLSAKDAVVDKKKGAKTKSENKNATRSTTAGAVENKKRPSQKGTVAKGFPSGARKVGLPTKFTPQLATLVDGPPAESDWLYEIKFDGYRLLTRIEGEDVRLFTRNGHDWTEKLPALKDAIAKLNITSAWLDGEIVVASENGIPNFQLLQNAFDKQSTEQIAYYLFDLPYHDGHDLRDVPLIARRALLKSILNKKKSDAVHYSETFEVPAHDIVTSACRLGLEGVIGKRKDSPYSAGRSRDWIKLKCTHRQEFVIGGFTDPKGSRTGLGSLILGVHDESGNLIYAGNVGTGFNNKTLSDLRKKLDALVSKDTPFASTADIEKKAHWVKPVLLAEVSFAEWTKSGHIRHAVFHALRSDKTAKAIVREKPLAEPRAPQTIADPQVQSILPRNFKVSHPERIVDSATGIDKIALIRYYALVASLMLPHLKARPVSLVRAPDGIEGQLFFQKHMESPLEGISLLDQKLDPGHAPLMEIVKPLGLLSAAQMNVIEFHTWNGVKTQIAKPDRMTFDLDPGEGVSWEIMQESTLLMGSFLSQLGLKSFVKTSGGKGMHVVVPLRKHHDWDTVKAFSQAIVLHMSAVLPQRFVAKSGPRNRVGKIFIDYLRNGFGATTVAAWSLRSRPGLSVSVPVAWDEVEKLQSSGQWTIANIHTRLDKGNTPWADYDQSLQNLSQAMKLLDFKVVR